MGEERHSRWAAGAQGPLGLVLGEINGLALLLGGTARGKRRPSDGRVSRELGGLLGSAGALNRGWARPRGCRLRLRWKPQASVGEIHPSILPGRVCA